MVVMTDATVVLGVALSLSADVRKHLKEYCLLISGLPGTIQGSKGKKKLPWPLWRQVKNTICIEWVTIVSLTKLYIFYFKQRVCSHNSCLLRVWHWHLLPPGVDNVRSAYFIDMTPWFLCLLTSRFMSHASEQVFTVKERPISLVKPTDDSCCS